MALVAVAVLAVGGGAAAKVRSDRPSKRQAISRQSIAPTTTSASALAAASATGKNRKPRHTTTTLPSTTTTSPSTTTTTAPGTPGIDVKIPLPGFGDMVVDEARGRLYISGGKGTNTVVVTDLEGGIQRTVDIGRGGGGMTLGPDGTKLYVALVDSDGIAIIDLTTYAVD